jgi:hypothetical protein
MIARSNVKIVTARLIVAIAGNITQSSPVKNRWVLLLLLLLLLLQAFVILCSGRIFLIGI